MSKSIFLIKILFLLSFSLLSFSFTINMDSLTGKNNNNNYNKNNNNNNLIINLRDTYRVSVLDQNVITSGRVERNYKTDCMRFDWSGVNIEFNVTGGQVVIELYDDQNEYNIFLNGTLNSIISTQNTINFYQIIGNNMFFGQTNVLITKRTEASFGISSLCAIYIDIGQNLIPTRPFSNRKLEFFGDSLTCGYGNEGIPPCSFSAQTENNYQTYGPMLARAFNASYSIEAWSGKGVVRNYGAPTQTSPDPMPIYFNRTLANDPNSIWNFSSWVPDAVVINLGTNDFTTQPNPSQQLFQDGYTNMLEQIRGAYGKSILIYAVCGPAINDPCCMYIQQVVKQQSSMGYRVVYIDMQNILTNNDYGCDGHPNVQGQQKMSNAAYPVIANTIVWSN
eukprot:TRINITY_DN5543_c0_g3_i2.p1 TRINITY_DN5543_c0_g3~~TRINITY_DN5543_c0_g3_i2.p1  ORF type:complete len:403 (-),score=164.65 TRINITY_DN5543_c0_g3_i2:104-1279(-)